MFDSLLLLTSMLIVAVLLRRLRAVEMDRARLARELGKTAKDGADKEALAAVGMLTNELSHLVLSPLTVILGQCELARSREPEGKRMQTIERQARRIANVMERFRYVGHEHRDEVQKVDPAEAARSVLDSLSDLAFERDVRIHEMIEPCPRIEANPALLGHALRHMLRTAIEAAPEGVGDVTLAVGHMPADNGPGQVAFAVADDGPGIPPEQLPRVFHPFPEGGASVRGEGFSYAVVYAIARAIGSTVVVDSAPGAGTRATLKVPLARPSLLESPAHQTPITNHQ